MNRKAILIAGLNYGDEGKGTTVDYVTREYDAHTVIRYNGGAQAAHHVVLNDGTVHCFAQFGAGTFVPHTNTYLSRYMLVNPITLAVEEQALVAIGITDAYERLFIDEQCLIITPMHQHTNRIKELARGAGRHGSCGQGIWETQKDFLEFPNEVIYARDLLDPGMLRLKLIALRNRKVAELQLVAKEQGGNAELVNYFNILQSDDLLNWILEQYERIVPDLHMVPSNTLHGILQKPGVVIFEGAQGVLLDAEQGFFPYTTGTRTTFCNADTLLAEANYDGEVIKLGILRAYMTRHGAGPFVTEDPELGALIPDWHNGTGQWQGNFRVGWFDLVATRYALTVTGPIDGLVITGLDRLATVPLIKTCMGYRLREPVPHFLKNTDETISVLPVLENENAAAHLALTDLISKSSPRYLTFPNDKEGVHHYAAWLAKELGVSLMITSAGATAADKITINPLLKSGFYYF